MTTNSVTPHRIYQHSQDVTIRYESQGQGDRGVVFLHGFGASLESWHDIRPVLTPTVAMYFLDLKGFGGSSKPRDDRYSLEDQAAIVSAFILGLNHTKVTLVGHSYGGAVALIAVLQANEAMRDRVDSLILLDAAAYKQRLPFFVSLLRNPVTRFVALNTFSPRHRAAVTLRRVFYDGRKVDAERIERYARYFDLPNSHYAFTQAARQVLPADASEVSNQIRTITDKTLILWGDRDPIIGVEFGRRLHTDIKGSQMTIVADCGHIPHEEQPRVTAEAINAFLLTI